MDVKQLIQESITARAKLQGLIDRVQSQNICDVGEYIDSLTERECKWILRMIAQGSWKDFAQE